MAKRMFKLVKISADLAKFMKVHEATRPDIQRAIWMHIKENKLQTENDKRTIHLDPALKELFPRATDPFSMYEITRYIKDHIILNTPTIEKKSPSE